MPTLAPPPTTNDLVEAAVAAKLDPTLTTTGLPDNWNVYIRRDMVGLKSDQWPRCYVVGRDSIILEEETDNQQLVGYPVAIVLMVKEATKKRTDSDLVTLRRTAQGAVYTTQYADLVAAGRPVEDVRLSEEAGVPIPDLADGVTATGFSVMIGLVEKRCPAEAVP